MIFSVNYCNQSCRQLLKIAPPQPFYTIRYVSTTTICVCVNLPVMMVPITTTICSGLIINRLRVSNKTFEMKHVTTVP